jgi:hypothetical protein
MPLTKPLLVKRILLKLVLVIDNPKSTEFGLKYITIVYNTSINLLLY